MTTSITITLTTTASSLSFLTTGTIEQQSTTRDVVKTFLSNPTLISSNLIDPPSPLTTNLKSPP
ncbi:unnamed protein product, partial [Rotaria magnacalcarata]